MGDLPCAPKIAYRDRIAALLNLTKTARKDHRRPTTETRAYRCPHCRRWHLTSRPKKGDQTDA